MAERDALPLPLDIRARIAELELELSEGECRFPRVSGPASRPWSWDECEAQPARARAALTRLKCTGLGSPRRVYTAAHCSRALMSRTSRAAHGRPSGYKLGAVTLPPHVCLFLHVERFTTNPHHLTHTG